MTGSGMMITGARPCIRRAGKGEGGAQGSAEPEVVAHNARALGCCSRIFRGCSKEFCYYISSDHHGAAVVRERGVID